MLDQEQVNRVIKRSLALTGSLHPVTRGAVRKVIELVDAHFVEVLLRGGWGASSEEIVMNTFPQLEERLVKVVKLHAAPRTSTFTLTFYRHAQHALFPLNDGMWSFAAALARVPVMRDLNEQSGAPLVVKACLAEIEWMHERLDLNAIKIELRTLASSRGYIPEVVPPLIYLYAAGPLSWSEFSQLLGHRNKGRAEQIIADLLADNLLVLGLGTRVELNVATVLLPGLLSSRMPNP